jgi:hypothetical protein
LECPGSLTVAASLGTVEFEDVVTSVEGDAEIEFIGFTSLPDVFAVFLHDLAVHHGDSSTAKVSWCLEGIGGTVLADWERDLVIVANIFVDTLAQGSVAHLEHVLDYSLTVSFSRWFGHLLLEFFDVVNRVLFEGNGLDEDNRISWLSCHCLLRLASLGGVSSVLFDVLRLGLSLGFLDRFLLRAFNDLGFTASAMRNGAQEVVDTRFATGVAPVLVGVTRMSTSLVTLIAWDTSSGGHRSTVSTSAVRSWT